MATTESRYWIPTRSYDFQIKIGKIDYTASLERLTLITSILTPCQAFILEFFLDPNDLILDRVYGQEKIELTLRLLGPDEFVQEEIPIELMYSSNKQPIMMKTTDSQETAKDRKHIVMTTVARKSFSAMYSIVNGLYFGETVQSIIGSSVNQIPSKPNLNFDTNGVNREQFDQVIIPPTTFHKSIKYLDETFGIYDGVHTCYCLFDNNIYIKNLSQKIKKSHLLTFHLLTADAKEEDIVRKPSDGKSFYIWRDIQTEYFANSSIGTVGAKQRHIFKPSDELYTNVDFTMEDISSNYGLISGSNKINYDTEAMGMSKNGGRLVVYSDRLGYNTSQTPARARSSRWTSELSTLKVYITSKNISILNLMNVGEAVKFETRMPDYTQLRGKYILKSSSIKFARLREWEANVNIDLIRTNRSMN